MSQRQNELREPTNIGLVKSMVEGHNSLVGLLSKYHVQVVESPEHLPGFVLADMPIFHGQFAKQSQKVGFGGGVAVGDADLVVGPLSRRVAVAFTAKREPSRVLTLKEQVLNVNRAFVLAAQAEVACHPDDALVVQRLIRSSNQLVRRV